MRFAMPDGPYRRELDSILKLQSIVTNILYYFVEVSISECFRYSWCHGLENHCLYQKMASLWEAIWVHVALVIQTVLL